MTAHPTIFMVTHPVPTECIGREGLCDSQQIKIWIIIFFLVSPSPHILPMKVMSLELRKHIRSWTPNKIPIIPAARLPLSHPLLVIKSRIKQTHPTSLESFHNQGKQQQPYNHTKC